jgi:hypothetical protein
MPFASESFILSSAMMIVYQVESWTTPIPENSCYTKKYQEA